MKLCLHFIFRNYWWNCLRILSPYSESDGSRWNINRESLEGIKKPKHKPPPFCRWIVCVHSLFKSSEVNTTLHVLLLLWSSLPSWPVSLRLQKKKNPKRKKNKSSFLHYINIGKLLLLSFSLSCWAYWANWSEFVSFFLQAWRGLFARDWLSGEQM